MKRPNSQGAAGATKAVGYARVSTPDQAERDLSLPAQMSRVYLQNLVDHIVIGEDEIVIEAKAGAALAMMAASRPAASESTAGEVLADVVDWCAPEDSNL